MKKFKLTKETKEVYGITLYRIKSLRTFSDVKKGDLGGFVEKESNLSHEHDAWIYDDAQVYDDAYVSCNARISNNACICGNAWVSGNAVVCDNALVAGNARVHLYAQVFDNASVYGNASIYGNSKVFGNAYVYDRARIYGNALVSGNAGVCSSAKVVGEAVATSNVLSIDFDTYDITVTDHHIKIGCQQHTKQQWWSFTDEEISAMDSDSTKALKWWKKWKPILMAILEVKV
jgi:carbonic anhydrase/acetyltransferase-like protein (isoleucine patch superfamily)